MKNERYHRLKIWPEFFSAVLCGAKTFEVRRDDRGFAVGDLLILEEYDPAPSLGGLSPRGTTGRRVERVVTYKLHGGQFGVEGGFCVLGLAAPQSEGDAP